MTAFSLPRRRLLQGLGSAALAPLVTLRVARAQSVPEPRTVASGLAHPWGLAFLPDGRMLVTERPGRLQLLSADGRERHAVSGVPAVFSRGQGGLLDVALRADGNDLWVWLTFSEPGDAGTNGTAVWRARLVGDALRDGGVIFRQTPKAPSPGHFGSRLAFAPDGLLFVTLGERMLASERQKAQDLSTLHGKVVRLHPDGRVPRDNPFVGREGVRPEIWSYGHRNPQGAAIHPRTGELWVSEHGPQGGDEINISRAGRNYGWPKVSYGCEYGTPPQSCTVVGGASEAPGIEPPLTHWVPSIAPSGLAFCTSSMFPEWRGQLFTGALAGQALWRLELDGDRVVHREPMLAALNERIRDVRQGPDGALWLLTDADDGRLLRLGR